MRREIANLLQTADSSATAEREEALLQLAMLLERSTYGKISAAGEAEAAFYADTLPPTLLAAELSEEEQGQVVQHLARMFRGDATIVSALWALGKATPKAGLPELLSLLGAPGKAWDADIGFQMLIALRNFLIVDDDGALIHDVIRLLREKDPRPALMQMASAHDERVSDLARHLIKRISSEMEPGVS